MCALFLGVIAAGCDISVGDGGFSLGLATGKATDEWTRTYTIAPGGSFQIENDNGVVEASPADGTNVEVRAERIVKASSDEAAQELLKSLELREEYDAILVGGGTVSEDDPQLTRRLGWNNALTPWTRIVLDRDQRVLPTARVLTDGAPTLLITRDIDLDELLRDLYSRGVQSLIVEGGSVIHSEFIRRRLWQKMVLFVAPALVGGTEAPSIFGGEPAQRLTDAYRFRFDRAEIVGGDLMLTAYPS